MNIANIDREHIHYGPAIYELTDGIKTNAAEQIVCKMTQRKIIYTYFYIYYFLFYLLNFLESYFIPNSSPQTPKSFFF